MKRKIIIYGLNFKPEKVGIGKYTGELAEWLSKENSVSVITSHAYFPNWKPISNGYKSELIDGIKIVRCPLWVPRNPNGLKRILHYLSFALSSLPVIVKNSFLRPDLIITIVPSFLCAPNAILLKFLSRNNCINLLHIQDFEIDLAFELDLIKGNLLRKFLNFMESFILKRFSYVSTISLKMTEKLIEKHVRKEKVIFFPNWVDLNQINNSFCEDCLSHNKYRKELNINKNDLVIMYSGSLNKKQGVELICNSINKLQYKKNFKWIIACEGPSKKKLIEGTKKFKNVIIMPLQPDNRLMEWLSLADIHLLPQKKEASDFVLPSKLLGIMASGKPVVASANSYSELGLISKKVGIRVDPDNIDDFSEAIVELSNNKELREAYGYRAKLIAKEMYSKEKILRDFMKKIRK